MHSQGGHKNHLKATMALRATDCYGFAGMKGRRKGVRTFISFGVKIPSIFNLGDKIQKAFSSYKVSQTAEKVKQ